MSKTYLDILKEHYPDADVDNIEFQNKCCMHDYFLNALPLECNGGDNCSYCWNKTANENTEFTKDTELLSDLEKHINSLPNGKNDENPLPKSSADTSVEVSDVRAENTENEINLAPDTAEKLNDKGVATLKLSIRNHNAILRAGCRTIGDIIRNADKLKDVAPKAYEEAAQALQNMGVHLPDVVEGVITYIDVRKIEPHPHNPRKDVGDVYELAESIKANGIMQNLTVVPWFADNDELDPEGKVNGWYRALIGHRRLAAARKAGLKTVPCVIARNLTLNEQVAIMLAENMQRSDLTEYEEAEGFQMMLDLGDTVDSISEKTGFSKSTIYRRTKPMGYSDKQAVKESFERGGTFADYEKLEKIKDAAKREELIQHIGTHNFNYELEKALTEQKAKEKEEKILELLSFAEKVDKIDSSVMSFVKSYYFWEDSSEHTLPKDYDEEKKYYIKSGINNISLYVEAEEVEIEEEAEEQTEAESELDRRKSDLHNIFMLMEERRLAFIRGFKSFPQEKVTDTLDRMYAIIQFMIDCEINIYTDRVSWWSYRNLLNYVEDPTEETKAEFCELIGVERFTYALYLNKLYEENGVNKAMRFVYYAFLKFNVSDYPVYNGQCEVRKESLVSYQRLYKFLELCGYEISDEEQAIIDGTHELYVKESDNE